LIAAFSTASFCSVAVPCDRGTRDVRGIRRQSVSGEFRMDARTARRRMIPFFESHERRALAENQPGPIEGKGSAGSRWILWVGRCDRPHGLPRPQNPEGERRLSSAGQHDIDIPAPDPARRLAHGNRSG
jgi:hypothetical protein